MRVELAAPQRELYKALLTDNYDTLVSGASSLPADRTPVLVDSTPEPSVPADTGRMLHMMHPMCRVL